MSSRSTDNGAASITVERALELPSLKRGLPEVLAGAANLGRPIRWVHITEDPHVTNTLKGGELVLTTGMGLDEGRAVALAFIGELAARGAVGLVIELGEPMPTVPDWLIEQARERDFPLICLKREVAFVEITEAMHSELVSHELSVFRRGQEVHERFASLVVEGNDVTAILAALADMIGNAAALEDHRGSLLFHASHGLDDRDVIAAWEAHRENPRSAATLAVPVPRSGAAAGGRLIAFALEKPFDEFDRIAVDRAAGVIALSLLRTHQDQLVAARERGNFLVEVIEGRLTGREAAIRADALGFASEGRALVPAAVSLGSMGWQASADIWHALRRDLDDAGYPNLIAAHTNLADIVVLVAIQHPDRRRAAADRVAGVVRGAVEKHLPGSGSPVIAVADATSWDTLAVEVQEACRTVEAGGALPERPWHDAAVPDLERLLWSLAQLPEMRQFAARRLLPLIEQDKRRNSALLETLEAFCECGGRKTAAAEALHLRRQALHYRLSRVEEILEADLDDEDTRLGLHLALRIRRHLDLANGASPG